jgi:serine/threonine-protein kinase
VLVVALALAAAGVTAGLVLTRPAPTYVVPGLKGVGLAKATALLAGDHLQLVVLGSQWDQMTKGSIVQQSPQAGARLHARGAVSVTVSRGPQPVQVPDLATLDLAQATAVLTSSSLRLGAVRRQTSMTVPEGMVISWAHRGHAVLPGTAISVVVSAGKPLETVPGAPAGTTLSQVTAELRSLGFHVAELAAYSDSVPPDQVIALSPTSGTRLVFGATITVTVSLGPHMVTIPTSVIGLSVEQAGNLLNRLGVGVYGVHGDPLVPVSGTLPAVGTRVHYGTSVILVTG